MIGSIKHALYLIMAGCVMASCEVSTGSIRLATPIDTRTPVGINSATPGLPFTQAPDALPSECKGPNIENPNDPWVQFLSKGYGSQGCKLAAISPDGTYLAFVTLIQMKDETGEFYAEAVKLKKVDSPSPISQIYVAHRMNFIGHLEWSVTDKLMLWESIWEGSGVTVIYDPVAESMLAKMRADQDTAWQWNPQHTAFYATRIGGYGANNCVGELHGYDFMSNSPFPALRKLFGIESTTTDPFVPSQIGNDLLVVPLNWSADGNRLWLTVTPLKWLGNSLYQFEMGPRQAGIIELLPSGPRYLSLGANPGSDYSFEGSSDPKLISQPYRSRFCPP